MSLAWGSIVILILLLPGFLFFVGIYFPEQFTRETAPRSALGQLAGTLVVSLAVHGLLYSLVTVTCGTWLPCVDLGLLFRAVTLDGRQDQSLALLASQLRASHPWVLVYLGAAAATGTAAGWAAGALAVRGRLTFLAQHSWIYDLTTDLRKEVTVAYVMTRIRQEERVLLYRGFLKAFGLRGDGRFSYVVLTRAVRYYMHLEKEQPRTSPKNKWLEIGASPVESAGPGFAPRKLGTVVLSTRRDRSYLVVEGEDIANVIFDRFRFEYRFDEADLQRLVTEVQSEARLPLSSQNQ